MNDVMRARPVRRHPLPEPKYRFVCVFPTELGAKVRDLAARERRTITAQVQLLVEQALERQPAEVVAA